MKVRQGFVSNSSSSSFVIQKKDLEKDQVKAIKNHIEIGKIFKQNNLDLHNKFDGLGYSAYDFGINNCTYFYTDDPNDAWTITENETEIKGSVGLDNFDMRQFFNFIGVDYEIVTWKDDEEEYGV